MIRKLYSIIFLATVVLAGACKPERAAHEKAGENPAPLANCSCTNMTITHAGNVSVCSDKNLAFAECNRSAGGAGTTCPNHTYKYTCPTDANSQNWQAAQPDQKTGFLATATLAAGSVTADCTYGQVLQESITSGGQAAGNPKINPTFGAGVRDIAGYSINIDNSAADEFPQVGEKKYQKDYYGGDNYSDIASQDVLSGRVGNELFWWDNTDQEKDQGQAEIAVWNYKFISFVLGSAGKSSCSCVFTINVDWKANTNPATVYAEAANGSNCTF